MIEEGAKQIIGSEIPIFAIVDGVKAIDETTKQNRLEFENGDTGEAVAESIFGFVYNAAKIVTPILIAGAVIATLPASAPVGAAIAVSAAIGFTFSAATDIAEKEVEKRLENKGTGEKLSAQEHFENLGSGLVKTCKEIFTPLSSDVNLIEPNPNFVYV